MLSVTTSQDLTLKIKIHYVQKFGSNLVYDIEGFGPDLSIDHLII